MRIQSSVTSLSWIPSEAIPGGSKLPFESGFTHYDQPPPDAIVDLDELQAADRFRFANVLKGWIEVGAGGRITRHGQSGGGMMGSTTVKVGGLRHTFQAVALPDLKPDVEVGDGWVRFTQTTGGRTGLPAPRPVRRRPFIQWQAPLVWTTLSLTIHADGRSEGRMVGASRFPRHWVYDDDGKLSHKSGLTDFKEWWRRSFGLHTPWGDYDSDAVVTAVETALERALAGQLMHGSAKPKVSKFKDGATIVRQGDKGDDVFLVLDGVIRIEHDGERLAEYGPGAMLGERAALESGVRTSTLVAVTPCRVASVPAAALDRADLVELSGGHRREVPSLA